MVTEYALTELKETLLNLVSYAQLKIGSSYTRVEISDKQIGTDGKIEVSLLVGNSGQTAITVTEIRLLDADANVLASRPESITLKSQRDGALYKFTFAIIEA